jgi:capsid protein
MNTTPRAVLNDLHDLDDLQLLEMDAAKENAKVSRVIETANGELSEDEVQRGTDEQVAADSGDITAIRRWYKETFGGEVEVMMRGDKYHQHAGERPSVVTQGYWDYLCSKICAGYGISKLLVYPWTLQGTVTRMDLDAQAGFFRSRSAVIASAVRRIWIWVMQWEKSNNRLLADPPADWTRINIRPPRSVNVDVGRNSSALIAEYEAGLSTLDDIYGPGGFDYREKMRQRAIEFAEARELEREFNLPPGTLIKSTLEVLKANQPKPEPKQLPAPEPEPAAP